MFDPTQLTIFLGASLALLLVPGPAVLYIVARSVNQGRTAGLASVMGIETANATHVVLATLGLSALLMTSALAFDIVKYAGAAYLVYLGIRKLLAHDEDQPVEEVKQQSLRRIYSQGVVVNLLNPKVALFFFAFLPQFVDPTRGAITGQILALGLMFVAMGCVTDSTYALLSSSIAGRLKGNRAFLRGQRYFAGLVYVGLGVTTALSGSKSK